jgi:hypothetical protein
MSYGALRIAFCYVLKCDLRVCICEGVKESDAAVELFLDGRLAGDGKGYFPEFFGCGVVVCFLGGREEGKE